MNQIIPDSTIPYLAEDEDEVDGLIAKLDSFDVLVDDRLCDELHNDEDDTDTDHEVTTASGHRKQEVRLIIDIAHLQVLHGQDRSAPGLVLDY